MEYRNHKIYWVVTEVFTGPTEWSDEDEKQEKPTAVFESLDGLYYYMRNNRQSPPRYNLYEIIWEPNKSNPSVGQYLEGLPIKSMVEDKIDRCIGTHNPAPSLSDQARENIKQGDRARSKIWSRARDIFWGRRKG